MATKKKQLEHAEEELPEAPKDTLEAPESPAEILPPPAAPVVPEKAQEPAAEPASMEVSEPPKPALKPAERYEVVAEKTFSYQGQFITLHKGDVIEPASYGLTFKSVLEDVGLELKKVVG